MLVKCLDASKQLLVVAQSNENLRVIPNRALQYAQWALRDLKLFLELDLLFIQLGIGCIEKLGHGCSGCECAVMQLAVRLDDSVKEKR